MGIRPTGKSTCCMTDHYGSLSRFSADFVTKQDNNNILINSSHLKTIVKRMVADISYTTVSNVFDSWEMVKRIPDFRQKAGIELFRIYFSLEPRAVKVFSFPEVNNDLFTNPRFVRHAIHYINMLDRAINLLGPDIELLTDIMLELGEQHYAFGVVPSYYPPMGIALLQVLDKFLGEKFTEEMRNAWLETFQALAYDMIRSKKKT